jgi:hypothetical protein
VYTYTNTYPCILTPYRQKPLFTSSTHTSHHSQAPSSAISYTDNKQQYIDIHIHTKIKVRVYKQIHIYTYHKSTRNYISLSISYHVHNPVLSKSYKYVCLHPTIHIQLYHRLYCTRDIPSYYIYSQIWQPTSSILSNHKSLLSDMQ